MCAVVVDESLVASLQIKTIFSVKSDVTTLVPGVLVYTGSLVLDV